MPENSSLTVMLNGSSKKQGDHKMVYYLSHCYSIAWDRLQNHLRMSVCVSVVTPTVTILGQFRWNFA